MKKIIITIIVVSLMGILYFIWGGDEQDLGDNYYFLPKYEAIDIGFPDGAVIYKASQKNIFNDIKINGDVVSANSNRDFVLAIQRSDSSNVGNDYLQYYIIVKKSDLVYGPYKKEEYLRKRKEFKVPKELDL